MKTATAPLPPLRSVKVLDQLRERIRYLHYSLRTEQAYVHWVRAFIRFHGVRHPATLGSSEVEAFLSWLANERKVSVSTHRQALAALLFFYGKVLCTDLPWLQEIGRPRPSRRLPVVLTPDEVVRILGFLEGEHRLFAQLLYGTGMRISEGLQLRVKDLDFDHGTIIVREGKGSKDRALMLPESLAPSLREQLSRARAWWLKDQAEGRSGVALPDALERKYPRAGHSWPWFWVFAQHTHSPKNTVRCVNTPRVCCQHCSSWRHLRRRRSAMRWTPSGKCTVNNFVKCRYRRQQDLSLKAGENWYSRLQESTASTTSFA